MKEYNVNNDKNIFDLTVELYGDISFLYELLDNNSLTLDADLTGETVVYNDVVKKETAITIDEEEESTEGIFTAADGQTLFDLAVMLKGGIEGVFDLIEQNGVSGIQVENLGGVSFKYNREDSALVKYIEETGLIINTGGAIVGEASEPAGVFDITFDNTFE